MHRWIGWLIGGITDITRGALRILVYIMIFVPLSYVINAHLLIPCLHVHKHYNNRYHGFGLPVGQNSHDCVNWRITFSQKERKAMQVGDIYDLIEAISLGGRDMIYY